MKTLRNAALFLGVALMLTAFVGCKPSDGMVPIQGKVTLDGTPIAKGSISFAPKGGASGTTSGAQIANGEYKARVSPGTLGVFISAEETRAKENPTQEEIERGIDKIPVEIVPAKYNTRSELSIDVADGAKGPFDFELTTE